MTYLTAIQREMKRLSEDKRTLFVGQAVEYPGQAMHATLKDVPMEKRLEMPVIENFQMGFCTGLALQGYIPICIFPRFDFLICAADQLVNHLDKIPAMTDWRPKVIIRTSVGAVSPLNPGPQHCQNHTFAMREMLRNVRVYELDDELDIALVYREAMEFDGSSLIIEHGEKYL